MTGALAKRIGGMLLGDSSENAPGAILGRFCLTSENPAWLGIAGKKSGRTSLVASWDALHVACAESGA